MKIRRIRVRFNGKNWWGNLERDSGNFNTLRYVEKYTNRKLTDTCFIHVAEEKRNSRYILAANLAGNQTWYVGVTATMTFLMSSELCQESYEKWHILRVDEIGLDASPFRPVMAFPCLSHSTKQSIQVKYPGQLVFVLITTRSWVLKLIEPLPSVSSFVCHLSLSLCFFFGREFIQLFSLYLSFIDRHSLVVSKFLSKSCPVPYLEFYWIAIAITGKKFHENYASHKWTIAIFSNLKTAFFIDWTVLYRWFDFLL